MRSSAPAPLILCLLALFAIALGSCRDLTAPMTRADRGGARAAVQPVRGPADGGEVPDVKGFAATVVGDSVILTIRLSKPATGLLPYPAWDWEILIALPASAETEPPSDTHALIARGDRMGEKTLADAGSRPN